jgi:AcrR family transcriptional regulator
MPVLGRNAEQTGERRAAVEARVVSATAELLAEGQPYADISVERIASRAGISRTAFYAYFRDKRELLMKLVGAAIEPIMTEADELVGGRPSGPTEIPYTIRAAMAFARGNRDVFRATAEAAVYDPVIGAFWREQVLGRFVDAIERRIVAQQERGQALPLDPRAAAIALVTMVVETLYRHVGDDEGCSDETMVETLVAIAVRAVYGPVDGESG